MLIGTYQRLRDSSLSLTLYYDNLRCVDNTKYLCLIIDKHLTWSVHLAYVKKEFRSKVSAICRLKPLPSPTLLRLFKVYVVPVFDYCDVIWMYGSTIIKLDTLCRRKLLLMIGLGSYSRLSGIGFTWQSSHTRFSIAYVPHIYI